MERSIENIWKKGFEAEKGLSAPVVSNLYKRKSGLVIQQINSTSKKDNLSLLLIAVILLAIFAFIGKVILGIYVAVLIIALFFLNKKMLKGLETLDIRDNTYSYLLNYRIQLKRIMRFTTLLIGLGLPLVTIPAYWMFFQGTKMLTKFRQLDLALEILLILGLAVFLSVLGILCYRLATKIVYGRLLARLESTIEDMEDLMKS
ncbi:hypothetical protein [Salegentibacter flavus]|uniref:Uncharacterized protein n=1 Tax=Salegentibacter flavus TaxID=287099 RepID=A0A1I4XMW0_9FLAO|nr:hypothetical protein [Salegentibacter flavus]SFN26966.1 hypothetical protein SAMN05660413_00163 [Salegentibacter flavus]